MWFFGVRGSVNRRGWVQGLRLLGFGGFRALGAVVLQVFGEFGIVGL